MKAKELPPVELLKELFDYDPLTGLLRWKKRLGPRAMPGTVAGTPQQNGYISIKVNNQRCLAHRICWAIYYNEQLSPDYEIDHIYGNTNDNRISELRKSNRKEQGYNRKTMSNNTSGHRGVIWVKRDKCWEASIQLNGKFKRLGRFQTKEEAIEARLKAEKDLNIFVGERP